MAVDARDFFAVACGLHGPLRGSIEGPRPGSFESRRPFLVVGRSPDVDLRIDDPAVGRRHAYFQVVDGRVFCIDLGSRTGVRWPDGPRPLGWVDPDRGVEVGPARIRFEAVEGAGATTDDALPISRSFRWDSNVEARLEFPGTAREPWRVSRVLALVGRSMTCRVRLDGPGVARFHAALVRTPLGFWAVNLLGPGGIRVGGLPSRATRVEDGDELKLGDQLILARIGPAGAQMIEGGHSEPTAIDIDLPRGLAGLAGDLDPVIARLLEEFDRMHRLTTEQFQQAILMIFRMHQDQMEVVRDGLGRIDRLEQEQRSLRAELDRGPDPAPPRQLFRLAFGEPTPSPETPGPSARRDRPWTAGAEGLGEIRSPAPSSGGPASPCDGPHARLALRIAEIRDERQGMWKKIISSLTGDGPEHGLP